MTEVIGWLGATMFAFCALPQVIKTYKTKSVKDFSWLFILMWIIGEILTFYYVLVTKPDAYPLLVNYIFNFFMVLYLLKVKIWEEYR